VLSAHDTEQDPKEHDMSLTPDTAPAADDAAHGGHQHADHIHGESCGHDPVQHDDHVDYVHDGHRHAAHDDHYDEH